MSETAKAALDHYVSYISSLDGILQVYLFGSHAYGTPNEKSDIDLMVIIEDQLDTVKTATKIQKGLADRAVSLDVLVNREASFNAAAVEPTLQRKIKNDGVLVYAK